MSQFTVLATPRSFAAQDRTPIKLLMDSDCQVIRLCASGKALEAKLWELLPQADAIIAGLEAYTRPLLERAAKLKVLSRYGVGYDNIDLDAAKELGIQVTNTPGANTESVADLAMALMLCAARNICPMNDALRRGQEEKPISGTELWGKTLGVIGTGQIGKGVIRRAAGFQMRILAYDTYRDKAFLFAHNGEYTDLDALFRDSDFISLHCPLTPETQNLVDARRLAQMKPGAILVNTARGGIIDETALYEALRGGVIAGAALDATVQEPPQGSPLLTLPNCILTPHAGAATREAAEKMGLLAARNVLDVLQGRPCPFSVT